MAVGTGVSVDVGCGVGENKPTAAVILAKAVPAAAVTIRFISFVGVGWAAPGKEQPTRIKTVSKKHTDFLFILKVALQSIVILALRFDIQFVTHEAQRAAGAIRIQDEHVFLPAKDLHCKVIVTTDQRL